MKTILISLLSFSVLASCSSTDFLKIRSDRLDKDKQKQESTVDQQSSVKGKNEPEELIGSSLGLSKKARNQCLEQMGKLPKPLSNQEVISLCESLEHQPKCMSVNNQPIFHFDKASSKKRHIKVLVMGTIHGDEPASGSLARDWIHRLKDLEPRSSWRILPITNPDGLFKNTRVNANGVDVNRNFPTTDWLDKAQEHWRTKSKSSPRRFPGNLGGSEPETKCIASHIEDFSPDFIISIHTPYGVLDFDGPNVIKPKSILPWRRLGHMPGSLGRFMWKDKEIPVLTIELKGNGALDTKKLEDLQDIIGTVAIRSLKSLGRW